MKFFFINQQYLVKSEESPHYLGQQANTSVFPGYLSGIPCNIYDIYIFIYIIKYKMDFYSKNKNIPHLTSHIIYLAYCIHIQLSGRNACNSVHATQVRSVYTLADPKQKAPRIIENSVLKAAFKLLKGKLSHFWTPPPCLLTPNFSGI